MKSFLFWIALASFCISPVRLGAAATSLDLAGRWNGVVEFGKFKFKMGVQDIIYPVDWQDENDPLRYITQRYTKGIEDFVRKDPAQYLWAHRRWKTRPKGEAPESFD